MDALVVLIHSAVIVTPLLNLYMGQIKHALVIVHQIDSNPLVLVMSAVQDVTLAVEWERITVFDVLQVILWTRRIVIVAIQVAHHSITKTLICENVWHVMQLATNAVEN